MINSLLTDNKDCEQQWQTLNPSLASHWSVASGRVSDWLTSSLDLISLSALCLPPWQTIKFFTPSKYLSWNILRHPIFLSVLSDTNIAAIFSTVIGWRGVKHNTSRLHSCFPLVEILIFDTKHTQPHTRGSSPSLHLSIVCVAITNIGLFFISRVVKLFNSDVKSWVMKLWLM